METRLIRNTWLGIATSLTILALIASPAGAQWVKVPPAAIPRTSDRQPDLAAPMPRLPDGTPDLSGIWLPDNKYDVTVDLQPEGVPFQPWAKALYEQRKDGARAREDPPTNCLPPGIPRIIGAPLPWKVVQMPGAMIILYEAFNLWRQIFLDGRELAPLDEINPTWLGYSTGRWEGDTLVVDTRGFNGKAWLDQMGKPTTEALHVIERFRRKDFGHMEIQITIDDSKAYTRPWTVTEQMRLLPGAELMEFICNENNRALELLPR